MARKTTSIATHRVDNCTITLVLDKRSNKTTKEYPLSVCFNTFEDGKHMMKLEIEFENIMNEFKAEEAKK